MKKRGIGFASAWQGTNYHFGHHDEVNINLEITDDLRCRIGVSVADMGQGIPEIWRPSCPRNSVVFPSRELISWIPIQT